jgi:predicted small lipoprotein YifL
MRSAHLLLMILLLATGCGQKGELYLRDKPPAGVKPPKPETFKPLPYPRESGEDGAAGAAKK